MAVIEGCELRLVETLDDREDGRVDIDRYAQWRRDDGQAFDPWIRTHERRGGRIVKPVPRSLKITGTITEWQHWTRMRFPDDGEYTFQHGLAPLTVSHDQNLGSYWEPNV